MGNDQLTKRQIETLRLIQYLTISRGLPPSIGDLRKALGVASDQAVLELLGRLERRSLIQRTPGQARGLALTNEGCLTIGAPAAKPSSLLRAAAGSAAPELNVHQQYIFKRLAAIDPNFATIYLGALRVLLDDGNPERIVQSAHSIRESTARLSDRGKDLLAREEVMTAQRNKSSNARQLEKLFDPLGGVRWIDQTLYDTWNREFHQFFTEVAHHGKELSIDEYRMQLARYEEFLSSYVLPLQTEIYERIETLLATAPGGPTVTELKLLLSRNVESYRYFFRNVDARWLEFLEDNNLLTPTWEVADYLARMAPQFADHVMSIIEGISTKQEHWTARRSFIDAVNKMPAAIAVRLVKKIENEKWLDGSESEWLAHGLNELLAKLVANSMHHEALQLTEAVLAIRPDGPSAHIGHRRYSETLKILSAVDTDALPQYIRMLVRLLGKAMALDRPETGQDGSSLWRPAIEEHEQNWDHDNVKDLLVTAVRHALERYFQSSITKPKVSQLSELNDLLVWNKPYSIFTRLKLHIYRLYPDKFMLEIERAAIEDFDNWEVWHEYARLLGEVFPALPPTIRDQYFQAVNRGPDGEREEAYIRHWKARKLAIIRDHLSPTEVEKYRDLIPEATQMSYPDLLSTHTFRWMGPTSPISEVDLEKLPISAVIEHLATWTPNEDWFSASGVGLGRTLASVVAKNGPLYSKDAPCFTDERIRPVYVYHLFLGLHEALKKSVSLDWQSVLKLAGSVIERAKSATLPEFPLRLPEDDFGTKWDGVFQEIASMLEAGLREQEGGLPFARRQEIWGLLEFLCEHPDPTPEHETQYGGNNMDPSTLSINSVRGHAFHALFAYIFWCDRHLKTEQDTSRIAPEAKHVLESHLDNAHDASLAVRSVYGQYFPWLLIYDPAWTAGLIGRIFPAADQERRYAAWETYLAGPVFPQAYKALRSEYELAIAELRRFKKNRRYWADPVGRLAHHIVVAYAYTMDPEANSHLWARFFRVADPKQRGMAVSFCGRAYVQRREPNPGEKFPETNRLQQFWEWRLGDSNDVDELKEFGWWVVSERFNDEWLLERVIETLQKTGGVIEADFLVLAALATMATQYASQCARAVSMIVKSRSADRLTLGHNEDIETILSCLYVTDDPQTRALVEATVDHLTKLGFERYRHVLFPKRLPRVNQLSSGVDEVQKSI